MKKNNTFHKKSKFKRGNSDILCDSVKKFVTYNMVVDQKNIFEVWCKYPKKEQTYSEKA
jgi:hypothetical protein